MREIQHCIGTYEPEDAVCNGDPGGEGADREVCTWRERCAGFQAMLKQQGKAPEDFVKYSIHPAEPGRPEYEYAEAKSGFGKFVEMCQDQIKRFGVVKGKATRKPGKVVDKKKSRGPTAKTQKKASTTLRKLAKVKRDELRIQFDEFRRVLAENIPGVKFSKTNTAVLPGRFYVVDRVETSGYMSVYCKATLRRDSPIVSVKFKPRAMTFDMEIPATVKDFEGVGKGTMKKLSPRSFSDGLFNTIMCDLDVEARSLLAEIIGKFIADGRIETPKRAGLTG